MYLWVSLSILLTSLISGVFGMAGGMILMGILTLLLPVVLAMVFHGFTQLSANSYRAWIHRENIRWEVLLPYSIGAVTGLGLLALVSFVPSRSFVLIAIGLFPLLARLVLPFVSLDILKPKNSVACGFVVTAIQLMAGTSGPILDVFYVQSPMNRFEVIATKSITQALGHGLKLIYYGSVFFQQGREDFPWWTLPFVVFLTMLGTTLGKKILDKLSDHHFQKFSQWIILFVSLFYLWKGLSSL